MRALPFLLAFSLFCLAGPAAARSTLEKYRELFTRMCWSVLQPELSVLEPEPRPSKLSPAGCEGLAEREAEKMAAEEEDTPEYWSSVMQREFDVCMRLHKANQGQQVTHGFCRLSEKEDESWEVNLNRFSELRLRKGKRDNDPEAARTYLLQVLPLGTPMDSARHTLSTSGFDCSPEQDEAKVTCKVSASYYYFKRSLPQSICGGRWIVGLGPLGGEELRDLTVDWFGGCV